MRNLANHLFLLWHEKISGKTSIETLLDGIKLPKNCSSKTEIPSESPRHYPQYPIPLARIILTPEENAAIKQSDATRLYWNLETKGFLVLSYIYGEEVLRTLNKSPSLEKIAGNQ